MKEDDSNVSEIRAKNQREMDEIIAQVIPENKGYEVHDRLLFGDYPYEG